MRRIFKFSNVKVMVGAAIAGTKEGEGPLSANFDVIEHDAYFGQKSWELAEGELQSQTASLALQKASLNSEDVDIVICGDLEDQCFASSKGAMRSASSMLGIYGACSTMSEALLVSSMAISGGFAKRVMSLTSSHFCAAEKQFRFPLEYGAQRPQTSQWTVTASGAIILEHGEEENGVYITRGMIGKPIEMGITDANNMGAAMAPAAKDTICEFLKLSGESPENYDLILTGDLGKEGSRLMKELATEEGVDLSGVHNDCGLMIYDTERQDVHSGGSGCGCSASVVASHILNEMKSGRLKRILYVATGALLSATSALQGQPITGIAHLVEMEVR